MGPPTAVLSRHKSHRMTLTAERKACSELNERPELLPGILNKFRQLIEGEEKLHCPLNEEFLIRFLRARKFKTDRAFKLLKQYFTMKRDHPELFKDLYPEALRTKLRHGYQLVLPDRDKEGRQIFLFNAGGWDPNECSLDDVFRCNYIFLEEMTLSPETQIHGIVAIVDFQGLGFAQTRCFTPKHALRMISVIQDSFPARFKEFHIVNQPYLFSMLFAVVKQFLSEKIRNRIHFHGSDLTSLHHFMDPSCLPPSLGGTNRSADKFLEELYANNDYYRELKDYGYDNGFPSN